MERRPATDGWRLAFSPVSVAPLMYREEQRPGERVSLLLIHRPGRHEVAQFTERAASRAGPDASRYSTGDGPARQTAIQCTGELFKLGISGCFEIELPYFTGILFWFEHRRQPAAEICLMSIAW